MKNTGRIIVAGYNKSVNVIFVKDKIIFARRYNENEIVEVLSDCNKISEKYNFKRAYIELRRSTFSSADVISKIIKSNIKIEYIKDKVTIPHNACRPERRKKVNEK